MWTDSTNDPVKDRDPGCRKGTEQLFMVSKKNLRFSHKCSCCFVWFFIQLFCSSIYRWSSWWLLYFADPAVHSNCFPEHWRNCAVLHLWWHGLPGVYRFRSQHGFLLYPDIAACGRTKTLDSLLLVEMSRDSTLRAYHWSLVETKTVISSSW